jgi:small subunit ribosomal protein S3
MGNKVNPRGFRLPQDKDWESKWFAANRQVYVSNLMEDIKIRKYLTEKLKVAGIVRVQIDRSINKMKISLHVSRPGVVIGRGGSGLEILKKELCKMVSVPSPEKNLEIEAVEVKDPDMSAILTVRKIAEELEKRMPYRRVVVKTLQKVMTAGAKGVKIELSGRIGGAEISRTEKFGEGTVPLQTIRADIDYAQEPAFTKSGYVGIKVWIYKGERGSK